MTCRQAHNLSTTLFSKSNRNRTNGKLYWLRLVPCVVLCVLLRLRSGHTVPTTNEHAAEPSPRLIGSSRPFGATPRNALDTRPPSFAPHEAPPRSQQFARKLPTTLLAA